MLSNRGLVPVPVVRSVSLYCGVASSESLGDDDVRYRRREREREGHSSWVRGWENKDVDPGTRRLDATVH